MSLVISH